MEDLIGVYGILDLDHWPNAPFLLLDGGVEKRWKEPYAFHNTDRGTYSGWLMQYTLSGTGWFEKNGKTYEMRPGRGFLCQIPENSRYYLHPESEEPWIFLLPLWPVCGVFCIPLSHREYCDMCILCQTAQA